MATLRSNFSQSDSELRDVLNLEGDLADVSIEGTLRIMVDSLKDSREEFRIFEEGDGWIHDLEERMVRAQDPILRRELLKSADLIRLVRSLSEIALIEMAEEGASDEDRRNCDEPPEVKAARDAQRREAILKLITDSMDEHSGESTAEAAAEHGPVSFDYGISVDGDSSFILGASEEEISSESWLQDNLREDSGDLIVARPADGESDWEPLSAESMEKIAELIEDDGCSEAQDGAVSASDSNPKDGPNPSSEDRDGAVPPLFRPDWSSMVSSENFPGGLIEAHRTQAPELQKHVATEDEVPSYESYSPDWEAPELDLEEEDGWFEEIDDWVAEIGYDLAAADSEEKREELTRRAALLKALGEAAWQLQDLNS